jgi:hypothetical protein
MVVLLRGDEGARLNRVAQQLRQQRGEIGATAFRQLPKALFAGIEYFLLHRQRAFLFHELLLAIDVEES